MSEKVEETPKIKKTGHWSKEEHARFMQGIQLYGKNWKKIVECVGTRSSNQIRSHAQKHFLKLEKKKFLQSPQNEVTDDAYYRYLQLMSYNAYIKFMFECNKLQMARTASLTSPVKVIWDQQN